MLLFGLIGSIIALFPVIELSSIPHNSAIELISWGLYFFPIDLWITCIANIILWIVVQVSWSTVEWVYKKIPGVD